MPDPNQTETPAVAPVADPVVEAPKEAKTPKATAKPRGPAFTSIHDNKPELPAPAKIVTPPELLAGLELTFGLPHQLQTKQSQIDYTSSHGYDGGSRVAMNMTFTKFERDEYENYARAIGILASPIDLYVAALRLFRANFPFESAAVRNISAFTLEA